MTRTRIAQTFALLFLAALLTPAAGATDARGSFQKSLAVTGAVTLEVQTGSGDISIKAGDGNAVAIKAEIHANDSWFSGPSAQEKVRRIEQNPPVTQSGNNIVVGKIEDEELRRNVSISYEISVPVETTVKSSTGSGDQVVQFVDGPVVASTGSGNVTITRVANDVTANTGSGDVVLDRLKSRAKVDTGSGNVRATGLKGAFIGHTGSGDITLENSDSAEVVAKTGSGNVRVSGANGTLDAGTGSGDVDVTGQAKGRWTVETGSGNVSLHLPQGSSFEIDARSSSGSVAVNMPVTVEGVAKPNRLRGKVGNGGALLSLETGSGDIHVN